MQHRLGLIQRPFTLLLAFLRSETGGGFLLIAASLLVAFVGWSVLLFSWPAMFALDERLVAPPLDPMSNQARSWTRCAGTGRGVRPRVVL